MTFNTISKSIYTANQIKLIDNYTINNKPIASIDLMEVAAKTFVVRLLKKFKKPCEVYIFCGPGNNGGDGLAIARLLTHHKFTVKIFIIKDAHLSSKDFIENYERLKNLGIDITQLKNDSLNVSIPADALIIDALFGAGLNKPLAGVFEQLIYKINQLPNKVISVDVPSGLHPNKYINGIKVKAAITISFQYVKLAFLLAENESYIGECFVEDIGLLDNCIPETNINYRIITPSLINAFFKKRTTFSHKGSYGHCLVVAGSYGKIGAALLSIKSVLKSGAGLVTAHLPKCAYQIVQSSIWEAMVDVDVLDYVVSETKDVSNFNAIAIGPGLGKDAATLQALEGYLKQSKPIVIDADALNLIAENQHLKKYLKDKILTPHPKEFERLFGTTKNGYERLEILKKAADKYKCTIVLKGANTAIANYKYNQIYFNLTGNNGLATAGSGDVLTGIISGLLAQGYQNFEAASLGVYLHGLSADIFIEDEAPESLVASDIIENMGTAFKRLKLKF